MTNDLGAQFQERRVCALFSRPGQSKPHRFCRFFRDYISLSTFGNCPSNEMGSPRKNAARRARGISFEGEPFPTIQTYKNLGPSYKGYPPKIVCPQKQKRFTKRNGTAPKKCALCAAFLSMAVPYCSILKYKNRGSSYRVFPRFLFFSAYYIRFPAFHITIFANVSAIGKDTKHMVT